MEKEGKRLNKYISDAGAASRREADRLIEQGKVQIRRRSRKDEPEHPAETASVGDRVYRGDTVYVEGRELPKKEADRVYFLYHKPCGVVCTMNRSVEGNLADEIDVPQRVVYAGRLDKDSSGLMILTNDGGLSDQIMRASHFHEKEYVVRVDHKIAHPDGLWVTTRPCRVKRLGERKFSITLTQGYNRQIRRMCRALGYGVSGIERIRIMNLRIGNLPCGALREMTEEEKGQLLVLAGQAEPDKSGSARPKRKAGWAVAKPDRSDRKPRNGWKERKSGTQSAGHGKAAARRGDSAYPGSSRGAGGRRNPERGRTGKRG